MEETCPLHAQPSEIITLRLSKRLGFLSNGGYESLSGTIDEVGRMLGGWLKYEKGNGSDGGEESLRTASAPPAVPKGRRRGGVRYRMTSPIVEKYLAAKLAHPAAVVFVTAGAFCQTFFEDALTCGRELHMAVRDMAAESETEKIFTCGLPTAKLIRGRGTHRAVYCYRQFARVRQEAGYVLQCDVRSYFASVDHGVLLGLRRIADARLLRLLESLVGHGAVEPGLGMPIGSLTSQMFADLYLDPRITSSKRPFGSFITFATWTTSSCCSLTSRRPERGLRRSVRFSRRACACA